MSLEFLISKIQKNNFLLIGRAGVDIYPDPPGTKTENANKYVTHLGGSSIFYSLVELELIFILTHQEQKLKMQINMLLISVVHQQIWVCN